MSDPAVAVPVAVASNMELYPCSHPLTVFRSPPILVEPGSTNVGPFTLGNR